MKNLAIAAALAAAVGTTTDAAACGSTPCGGTTPTPVPGVTVNTNNYNNNANANANANNNNTVKTDVKVGNETEVNVNTKGTVGNVSGGNATVGNVSGGAGGQGGQGGKSESSSSANTSNSGNSTNNNTTVYESRRIPVSTAYGATAAAGYADGCAMTGRGFGLGVQTIGVGVSGNMSGNKVWNADSESCHAAALETEIVRKNDTPAEKAAAYLTASEKSEAVKTAVGKLQTEEGKNLMGLFAVPASGATQPVINNYITNTTPSVEKAATPYAAQPKALKMGE